MVDIPGCSIVDFSKKDYCVDPADVPDDGDEMDEDVEDEQTTEVEDGQSTVIGADQCNRNGIPLLPFFGEDSAERMLFREGVIDEVPSHLCDVEKAAMTKNVILVR